MRCSIWYHLCNLKSVKNTNGGVLLLVKLQALKATLLHPCFLNCANGTKLRKVSHMKKKILFQWYIIQFKIFCSLLSVDATLILEF